MVPVAYIPVLRTGSITHGAVEKVLDPNLRQCGIQNLDCFSIYFIKSPEPRICEICAIHPPPPPTEGRNNRISNSARRYVVGACAQTARSDPPSWRLLGCSWMELPYLFPPSRSSTTRFSYSFLPFLSFFFALPPCSSTSAASAEMRCALMPSGLLPSRTRTVLRSKDCSKSSPRKSTRYVKKIALLSL
jgi:hypothetical protein